MRLSADTARSAATGTMYEVWRNGIFTNRRFSSIVSAERYAARVGGEVRAVR